MSQLIALNQFGFLKISGVDAVSFMQGYTTCDLAALTEDSAQLGVICNIQGRMLSSFIVIQQGQDLVMRMHRELIPVTIAFLAKYIVFSKAELADISENLGCYGALEPGTAPTQSPFSVKTENETSTIDLGNRNEQWISRTHAPATVDMADDWIDAEIEAGMAWVDERSCEEYLPQSLNYHELGGISFTKGCYLGQEIVARMQYRGQLKNKLHRINSAANGRELETGSIVVAGSSASLAVLSNPTADPLEVNWSDGATDSAIPLAPEAKLEMSG